jgi:hypothetical protein
VIALGGCTMREDPDTRPTATPDDPLTRIAALGAVAVAAGLAAYLARPGRRSAPARGQPALIAYLHDHLGGADMAIRVTRRLASTHQATEDRTLFGHLCKEFDEDRAVVQTLLAQLGASRLSMKRASGVTAGTALSVAAGGEPGDLSLFRTLEALAIGVQGKRCLWRALQDLRTAPAGADAMNFAALEARALRQWEAIEARRRALVVETFAMPPLRAE